MHLLGQCKDHNFGRKHEDETNEPIFFIYFSRFNCNIHFLYLKIVKTRFHFLSFGPFGSVKYLNFGEKLPTRTTYHSFLENRHPKITENPYYVLLPKGAENMYQLINMKDCNWINDVALEQGLMDYVRRSLKGKEILDFMKRDHEQYCWSNAALYRRLRFFDINYVCT